MSSKTEPQYIVDESLQDSLRYTEHLGEDDRGPKRVCSLWILDDPEPVSSMAFLAFNQRFGATAVPVEGIGDVATNLNYQRRGYITMLMQRALSGAASRVDALFLFGISGLYEKFGFANCLAGSKFSVWLKHTKSLKKLGDLQAHPLTKADLPEFLSFFNARNAERPWTRVRDDRAALKLFGGKPFRPGPEGILLKAGGTLHAYALVSGHNYGWGHEPIHVHEAFADSPETAEALLAVLRERGVERWEDTLSVETPVDSIVGRTVRRIGGRLQREYKADGGGMGLITNRASLVATLAGELRRRAGGTTSSAKALEKLASASLLPDNPTLLKLLVGFWSWNDAEFEGAAAPDAYTDMLRGWFPGGGTSRLEEPIAYGLDGY